METVVVRIPCVWYIGLDRKSCVILIL